uniref:E2F-associated phosphoprotein n=1 Tax=Setaria digitata TaxID=48799 RepID=A0A915PWA5_9BILA
MNIERLEPLEALEKDYYLGERNGWYSDVEQRDSESSDDELREKLSELAGVRCDLKKKQHEKPKKDEFESDMDDELSESFVAHASKMFSPPKEGNILRIGNEIDEMEAESNGQKTLANEGVASSAKSQNSSDKSTKSVFFENQSDSFTDIGQTEKSSFDDEDNLLRKAVNKATRVIKNEAVEFYDSEEDEDNEHWVHYHREQLKIVKSFNSSFKENEKMDGKSVNHETDAALSCPACMSLLTRDCQRHELYRNQYRAIFVENCNVVRNEMLFLPQSGKNKRKSRKNAAGIKPNSSVDPGDVATLPKEDLFHPVLCSICSTNVGVYDYEEVFHFFNVLAGYA